LFGASLRLTPSGLGRKIAPGDFFFEMHKETGERNAPHGSLVPDGQPRERTPERGSQLLAVRANSCLADIPVSHPRPGARTRGKRSGGTERQNRASVGWGECNDPQHDLHRPRWGALRLPQPTFPIRSPDVWGAFCFDSRFPCGLASSVRPGAGCALEVCPSGTRPSGTFLSPLSLGVQRKRLGRVTQVGSILETLIRVRNEPQRQKQEKLPPHRQQKPHTSTQSPTATDRRGSRIHSLQDPG
jgi:hypothetical protein